MDIAQIFADLLAKLNDAVAALKEATDNAFVAGAASRQAEVDDLKAQIVALQNPNPDPLQGQLDAALAQVADLVIKLVVAEQALVNFKAAELEKVKALEVDFT